MPPFQPLEPQAGAIMPLARTDTRTVSTLLAQFGLRLQLLPLDEAIPGSYWGAPEAGLIGTTVYVRPDTPLHSLLHESCHVICMDETRREQLHTDAGGETPEEDAVCYLQILLADRIPGFGRKRALSDMDAWGYTFRLGSAQRWFEEDAEDARQWLLRHALIDNSSRPCYRLRRH